MARHAVAARIHDGAVRAASKHKNRGGRQPEKEEVHGNDIVQDLLVAAGERDHDGPDALQHDRHDRHAGARMQPGEGAEEQAVIGHREIDARRGQDGLAEKAQRRDGDCSGNKRRAALAQGEPHHCRCRRGGGGERLRPERAHADPVHCRVERDHSEYADQQATGQVLARVFDFGGDEVRRLPATVGEQHRHHGSTKGCQRERLAGRRACFIFTGERQPVNDQRGDGGDLHHHQCALRPAATFYAQAIDERKQAEGDRRNQPVLSKRAREFNEIACEGDGNRRHAPRLDDQQQHPPVEERDRGMVGLAQVSVLASDCGQCRCQFRPDESATQTDDAAENPCAQNQRGRVYLPRDHIRIDEDAGTDNAPHDHHGRVEQTQLAHQARSGIIGNRSVSRICHLVVQRRMMQFWSVKCKQKHEPPGIEKTTQ